MSIRRCLILMMATLFMMGVSYLAYDLVVYKNDLEAQKYTQLNNLVRAQASQLGAMLSSGMSEQEALIGLKEARYAGNEYFFVIDRDLTMVMHPFKESLNGTSVASSKDPDGGSLFREMRAAVSAGGSGFVNYKWPRPGSSDPVPKLTAVTNVSGSDLIIGTGVYIDDISALVVPRSW